jgi:hypothetical protein
VQWQRGLFLSACSVPRHDTKLQFGYDLNGASSTTLITAGLMLHTINRLHGQTSPACHRAATICLHHTGRCSGTKWNMLCAHSWSHRKKQVNWSALFSSTSPHSLLSHCLCCLCLSILQLPLPALFQMLPILLLYLLCFPPIPCLAYHHHLLFQP